MVHTSVCMSDRKITNNNHTCQTFRRICTFLCWQLLTWHRKHDEKRDVARSDSSRFVKGHLSASKRQPFTLQYTAYCNVKSILSEAYSIHVSYASHHYDVFGWLKQLMINEATVKTNPTTTTPAQPLCCHSSPETNVPAEPPKK